MSTEGQDDVVGLMRVGLKHWKHLPQLRALHSRWTHHFLVCVVLLSVTHAHAQEVDMTPQQIIFDAPSSSAPQAEAIPAPPTPTTVPPPPPVVATSPWQKSMAFQLRPSPEPVTYGGQIALAYLMPMPFVPIVHGLFGNLGRGFLSVLGLDAASVGGMYAGMLLVPSDDTGGHVPTVNGGALLGFLVGWIGWIIFDANALAVEDSPPSVTGRLPSFVYERH